jgi:hypothetical protein
VISVAATAALFSRAARARGIAELDRRCNRRGGGGDGLQPATVLGTQNGELTHRIHRDTMGLLRSVEIGAKQLWINGNWHASMLVAAWREPSAADFYRTLKNQAYLPDELVKVLPERDVIYLVVPKAASTRIRATLAAIHGRYSRQLKPSRWGKLRGPEGPRSMTVRAFYRLATNQATLRFSFVRNPYTRLLSCWADKFQDNPLLPGSPMIDDYLDRRRQIDHRLPAGADQTLSFAQFVIYAAATANSRHDPHLQLQDDILSVPGIALDVVGRTETFDADFAPVLDHLGASDQIRRMSLTPLNQSRRGHWSDYYTAEVADMVYRAYERDFDRFGYQRSLSG